MPRKKYRSQAGIVHDILESLQRHGPLPATRLATYANLPYDRLRIILASLEANGLVEKGEDGRYFLTPRGLEALEALRRTRRIIEGLGFRL